MRYRKLCTLHTFPSITKAYFVALDGADAIALTAGIGENNAMVRERIMKGLAPISRSLQLTQHWQESLSCYKSHMTYILCGTSSMHRTYCTLLNLVQTFSNLLFSYLFLILKIYFLVLTSLHLKRCQEAINEKRDKEESDNE